MKKWTAVLLVLVLLMGAAGAMGETTPDLFDLYDRTEDGLVWIGNAVPILDGVVSTSPVGLPETVQKMEIWDGAAYREVLYVLETTKGTLLVIIYQTDGEKPAIPEYDFADEYRDLLAENLIVRSGDRMKSRINRAVADISRLEWMGLDCLLLTLSGESAPGAVLVAEDGKAVGILVAEYAEGDNRYIALTVKELRNSILEASDLLEYAEGEGKALEDTRPEGYTVTMEGNQVTFGWKDAVLPQAEEGKSVYHVMADVENSYLTYLLVDEETTEMTVLLTPGRTYVSGFVVCADTPDVLPDECAVTVIPEAEPMTEYNFKAIQSAIAERAVDAEEGAMPVPVNEVTEELLRSDRSCFYSCSSYEMPGTEDESRTLLVTLTAPDGNNYRWESGWIYMHDIQDKDEWAISLWETGLLEMLERNGYPEGTYEVCMYIDGKLADSFSFELIK